MNNLAISEAKEAPGWEIIDVGISNDNQKKDESVSDYDKFICIAYLHSFIQNDPLLAHSSFTELQGQWIELAQAHIRRLRNEIEEKERTIERLEVENRALSRVDTVRCLSLSSLPSHISKASIGRPSRQWRPWRNNLGSLGDTS